MRAEPQGSQEEKRQRAEVQHQTQMRERQRRHPRQSRQHVVVQRQPSLRIDQRAVAGKERRVELPVDDRQIEGLVRRAVAIAGTVHRGEHDEHKAEGHIPKAECRRPKPHGAARHPAFGLGIGIEQ